MRLLNGTPLALALPEAFLYHGASVFTTLRAEGGRPLWLYVTLEPCLMCHHALAQAGVEVVYGAENLKEGALTRFGLPTRARGGVRERECAKLLRDFFARLREGCRSG